MKSMKEWRCFHCDEVFTDEAAARDHFGETPATVPACQPSDVIVRDLLKQIRALNREVERLKAPEPDSAALPHLDTCRLKYGGDHCTCGLVNPRNKPPSDSGREQL